MLSLLVSLLILCVILGFVWWIFSMIPDSPPCSGCVRVIFAIICLVAVISSARRRLELPCGALSLR